MDINQRTTLYAQLSDNVNYTRLLITDFLTVAESEDIREKIPASSWSYTQSIVVNLAKIFSKSSNEFFRLERFKELGRENINERIERIEAKHKFLIKKILNNRDKLFAHTDRNFTQLLFSRDEIERMEKKFGGVYKKLLSAEKENERFTPTDLKVESDNIKDILSELDEIFNEAIMSDIEL